MHKALVLVKWPAMAATAQWASQEDIPPQQRQAAQAMALDTRYEQEVIRRYPDAPAVYAGDEQGLWALVRRAAGAEGSGAVVEAGRIPLLKLTARLALARGVSPYEADCRGCLIAVSAHGADLAGQLCAMGIPAAVIGRLTGRPGPVLVEQDGGIRSL